MNIKKRKQKNTHQSGFTLVEFIVVITIFAIMSGVSLFNYNEYEDSIVETNISQEVAQSIRQAQVYGLSSSDRVIGAQQLDEGVEADNLFGVSNEEGSELFDGLRILDITQDKSIRGIAIDTSENKLVLFEDLDRSNEYESATDRVIDERALRDSDISIDVCLINSGGSPDVNACDQQVSDSGQHVSITFRRPYPDAYVYYEGVQYSYALVGVSDFTRYVEVSPVGRISLKKNSYEDE